MGIFIHPTRDALNKAYFKTTDDGIILVDDCGWPPLMGPKLACEEFLEDKEEELELTEDFTKNFNLEEIIMEEKIVKGGKKVTHSTSELQKLTGPKEVKQPMPFAPPPIENTDIYLI